MQFKVPKDDARYHWTQHVVRKMLFYGLSADRVKRVIRTPKRMEKGIAESTLAAMQPAGSKKKPWEIWVMYREEQKKEAPRSTRGGNNHLLHPTKKVIITAWRYPGVSPVREEIPIPTDILAELKRENLI